MRFQDNKIVREFIGKQDTSDSLIPLFIGRTIYIILQEGDRGQQKIAKLGSWLVVGGFKSAALMSRRHDFIRLAITERCCYCRVKSFQIAAINASSPKRKHLLLSSVEIIKSHKTPTTKPNFDSISIKSNFIRSLN